MLGTAQRACQTFSLAKSEPFQGLSARRGAWGAWVEDWGEPSLSISLATGSSGGCGSMAAVLAVLTSDPNLLRCQLRRLEGQVAPQAEPKANAVGVGTYADGEVLLRRLATDAGLTLDSL